MLTEKQKEISSDANNDAIEKKTNTVHSKTDSFGNYVDSENHVLIFNKNTRRNGFF